MGELDALVRRVDEDRWLAARFAGAKARAQLTALYAVNYEIARIGESVRDPALGDIRLAWWREALGEVAAGRSPRAHPVLASFARADLAPQAAVGLQAIATARGADLDVAPFVQWGDLERYLDATAGALMKLAMQICAPRLEAAAFIESAARAWGLLGLARAEAFWRARGRSVFPSDGGTEEALRRASAAFEEARQSAQAVPARAFPAYGYIALVPTYLRAPGRGPGLFERQMRLVIASATGRL